MTSREDAATAAACAARGSSLMLGIDDDLQPKKALQNYKKVHKTKKKSRGNVDL